MESQKQTFAEINREVVAQREVTLQDPQAQAWLDAGKAVVEFSTQHGHFPPEFDIPEDSQKDKYVPEWEKDVNEFHDLPK